jgi:[acyl-carrier-protein] S-malonyltransferase
VLDRERQRAGPGGAGGHRDDLATVAFSAPSAPVVSNDDGEPYSDAEGWRTRSAAHVAVPVRWRAVQTSLVTLGAERLLEVGHGTMLTALAKRAVPGTPVVGIADPASADDFSDDA